MDRGDPTASVSKPVDVNFAEDRVLLAGVVTMVGDLNHIPFPARGENLQGLSNITHPARLDLGLEHEALDLSAPFLLLPFDLVESKETKKKIVN